MFCFLSSTSVPWVEPLIKSVRISEMLNIEIFISKRAHVNTLSLLFLLLLFATVSVQHFCLGGVSVEDAVWQPRRKHTHLLSSFGSLEGRLSSVFHLLSSFYPWCDLRAKFTCYICGVALEVQLKTNHAHIAPGMFEDPFSVLNINCLGCITGSELVEVLILAVPCPIAALNRPLRN